MELKVGKTYVLKSGAKLKCIKRTHQNNFGLKGRLKKGTSFCTWNYTKTGLFIGIEEDKSNWRHVSHEYKKENEMKLEIGKKYVLNNGSVLEAIKLNSSNKNFILKGFIDAPETSYCGTWEYDEKGLFITEENNKNHKYHASHEYVSKNLPIKERKLTFSSKSWIDDDGDIATEIKATIAHENTSETFSYTAYIEFNEFENFSQKNDVEFIQKAIKQVYAKVIAHIDMCNEKNKKSQEKIKIETDLDDFIYEAIDKIEAQI